MEDKETFGVGLEVETSEFKKQMQDLVNKTKIIGKEIKENLKIKSEDFRGAFKSFSKDIDYNVKKAYKSLKDTIKEAYSLQDTDINTSYDKQIEQTERKINELINTISKLKETATDEKSKQEILDMEVELEKLKSKLNGLYDKRIDILDWEQTEQFIINLEEELENLENLQEKINSGHKNIGVSAEVVANAIEDTKFQIELAKSTLEDFNNEGNKAKQIFNNLGNEISKGFNQVTKNIKRVTLSMVGVHSAYYVLSRAVSSYAQYDTDYTNKMKSAWASLGAFLAPITSMIGTAVQKMVAYLNVFVKVLTGGTDYIKNANEAYKYSKSLKEVSKSAKEATKSLTAMDEITNINDNDISSSTPEEDFNPFQAIEDIELDQEWVKKIQKIAEALKPVYEIIKNIVDWSIKHPDVLLGVLGGIAVIKTISNILGFFSGIGNATGLLGLFGVLTSIIALGAIVLSITVGPEFYETKKIWDDLYKKWEKINGLTGDLKNSRKYRNSLASINEEEKNRIKNDLIMAKDDVAKMKAIKKEINSWGFLEHAIKKANGELDTKLKEYETLAKSVEGYTEGLDVLADKNLLGIELEKEYRDLMGEFSTTLATSTVDMKENDRIAEKWGDTYKKAKKEAQFLSDELGVLGGAVASIPNNKNIHINADTSEAREQINRLISDLNKNLNSNKFKLGIGLGTIAGIIPSYDVGTPYVPNDGLAMIHKGERIIPAEYNNESLFNGSNNETTNALLVELIQAVEENGEKVPVFNLNGKEFAKATYNDYQNEGNRLNQNTIIRRV